MNGTERLLLPVPRLFLLAARIEISLPFFKFFNVQEVFFFVIKQVLPPPKTLVLVILDPPLLTGNEIVTLTFTFPLLAPETETLVIAGEEGFTVRAFAGVENKLEATIEPQTTAINFDLKVNNLNSMRFRTLVLLI